LPIILALGLSGGGLVGAQERQATPTGSLVEPFARKTITGEVMSMDQEQRTVVVRVIEDGKRQRDVAIALDDRTVLKKLRTPISGGDLSPGHLVKVTYSEHTGRLVARRIEVTGKAVHQPMP
jgi:hypothetical protein